VDIERLIGEIVALYQATAKPGEVSVVFHRSGAMDPIMVQGREGPMGQVFRNLIDNARSFSPHGGEVVVALQKGMGQVTVTVSDNGPGIPPENLETVFERFYTSRPKGAAFGGNSGLGLSIARQIVEEHLELCLAAGINHEGINAEVAKGQWEFQIFAKGSTKAADDTWTARYLLLRLCEKYGIDVQFHCKPIRGDWNGSGMHTNFSTAYLREVGGKEYFEALMAAFDAAKADHIAVYGPDNHLRLTGHHETQSIDKFSYGLSDRGASIRMPVNFIKNGYKGYLEDRRPNSEADPYAIVSQILKTIHSVPKP
jgi:glutamine synthetase